MGKKYIIAIGHRARQGKDTIATFIKESLRSNHEVHILHWADALYAEVRNDDRRYPLIKQMMIGNTVYYNLLHTPYSRNYMLYTSDEIPTIHELMQSRNLEEYWGMDEKDAPMLQAWGTNFRRQKIDELYWVNRTFEKVYKILSEYDNKKSDANLYICIPDTRFLNEYNKIQNTNDGTFTKGVYFKVIRRNEDGTQFIDPSRDPNHPSEAELEGVSTEYVIEAKSGDLETLKKKTSELLDRIDI